MKVSFSEHVANCTPEGYDLCLDSVCIEHGERRCTDYNCEERDWLHWVKPNEERHTTELGFSWRACESCGSTLGGDRYSLSYVGPYDDKTGCDIIELSSCVDCLMLCANGDEPEDWTIAS